MPVHLFAFGIYEDLGGDQHDLVLFEQIITLFHYHEVHLHLIAVFSLNGSQNLFHLLAGETQTRPKS
jgi:hypothetical protein